MAHRDTDRSPIDRLAQARAHRQAGRYTQALALLTDALEWPQPESEAGALLAAQILARVEPVKALELLARGHDLFQTDEGQFGYYVASMRAYIGTRNYDAAAAMGAKAQPLAARVEAADRCLLWHQRALLRMCLEQYDPSDGDIASLVGSSDPNGRFLGLLIRSYHHAGLGQYDRQIADLTAALEVAGANPGTCDPGIVALQVLALLRLGLERADADAVAAANFAYEWMPWSEDLRADRFLCVRSLAWDAFLRGESAQAQWLLKDSKDLATTDAWKVMSHLDRAYIARMNGNEHWAAEELYAAHELARGVEWGATQGEERQALVMLAVLYAPSDMALAQHYVSLYLQIGRGNVNPVLSLAHDRRAVAFEKYALGRVQQVLGNDEIAVASFESAYEIFTGAGYAFRAALAALAAYETNRDGAWLERARSQAANFPNSALRAMLQQQRTAQEHAALRDLTPMQRQVAMALCEGLDLAQLSQRFSRSAYTLEKHAEAVYQRLGVKNRSALRAAMQDWAYV